MILVDANLLLYARDETSPHHLPARDWMTRILNGKDRVGLPWVSLSAFVRIATHPQIYENPLTAREAADQVDEWLAAPPTWTPGPTPRHREIFASLLRRHQVAGSLVPDAHLAAIAIGHGLTVASTDSDFATFDEVTWVNPIAE